VTVDDLATVQNFAKLNKLTFDLLSDPDRTATKSYGVYDPGNETGWPALFILAKGGKIVFRAITDDYRKRPKVEQILAELDKLGG